MNYTNRRGMKVARQKRRLNRIAEQGPVWNPENPDTSPPQDHKEIEKKQDVEKSVLSQD